MVHCRENEDESNDIVCSNILTKYSSGWHRRGRGLKQVAFNQFNLMSEFIDAPTEFCVMTKKKKINLSPKYQVWIDARKKFRLSQAHIQMARELGMNPKKFGKLDNHHQEPWKEPLPDFIESLYFKRLNKQKPENARSVEQIVKDKKRKKSKD